METAAAEKQKKETTEVLELQNMIGGEFVDPAEGKTEDVLNPATGGVYAIVDSGHGFKTLAIGRLAAAEIARGKPDPLLEPFRASRFERGELLAASKGPYPWT